MMRVDRVDSLKVTLLLLLISSSSSCCARVFVDSSLVARGWIDKREEKKKKKRKRRKEQLGKGLRVAEHRESYVICRMENSKGKDEEALPV